MLSTFDHPQDLEAVGNMPLVMSTFQAGSRTKAIGLGMGPQDILHRCVLDVLKMSNRNGSFFRIFMPVNVFQQPVNKTEEACARCCNRESFPDA